MHVTALLMAISLAMTSAAKTPHAGITADYLEVRSASVFAGACHYNGEVVTTGQDALMAWHIESGKWNQTDLAGVNVVVQIAASANLANPDATRKSEVVIDSAASAAQVTAVTDLLSTRYKSAVGEVVSVHRATIHFAHEANAYAVDARGFATLRVDALPNDECCKQPNLVWYTPLVGLKSRKVGYTSNAAYLSGTNGDAWQRSGENSAFYGILSF